MFRFLAILPLLSLFAVAAPVIEQRQTSCPGDGDGGSGGGGQTNGCPRYTLINTRGTGEPQGESSGFRTMNARITSQKSGGQIYNTDYRASFSQISTEGTRDIVDRVTSTLQSDPDHCFILQGYSQGAAATTNALEELTGAAFDAVKGVFLLGNPQHNAGLACNIDMDGGTSTLNVDGLSARLGAIPQNWISKTRDVCNFGDGVCDTQNGRGINAAHLAYPRDSGVQEIGTTFALERLNA